MIPGEVFGDNEPVPLAVGRPRLVLRVVNTADRPVQVGSHYHFAEVNPGLTFERDAAGDTDSTLPPARRSASSRESSGTSGSSASVAGALCPDCAGRRAGLRPIPTSRRARTSP